MVFSAQLAEGRASMATPFHLRVLLNTQQDWRDKATCARIYRPRFRENKPKMLVFTYWKLAFWACFRENWVYNFGQCTHINRPSGHRHWQVGRMHDTDLIHDIRSKGVKDRKTEGKDLALYRDLCWSLTIPISRDRIFHFQWKKHRTLFLDFFKGLSEVRYN
jgi:hypothetical protein